MSITPLPQALIKPYESLNPGNCEINKDEVDVESPIAESSSLKSREIEVIVPKKFTQPVNESTPLIRSHKPVLQKKPIKKERNFWDSTQLILTFATVVLLGAAQNYQSKCPTYIWNADGTDSLDYSNCQTANTFHFLSGCSILAWLYRGYCSKR